MSNVQLGKEYKMENVLSLRKKMIQLEIQQGMKEIQALLQKNEVQKNGPVVTTTFAVEQNADQQVLDMEILVPLDKKMSLPEKYLYKKIFHLKNAIYARHEGNPALIQNTLNKMIKYIQENKLQQITSVYNVNVKELKQGDSMDDMTMDLYIGVNPSIL